MWGRIQERTRNFEHLVHETLPRTCGQRACSLVGAGAGAGLGWLVLVFCERKTLLAGWFGLVETNKRTGWETNNSTRRAIMKTRGNHAHLCWTWMEKLIMNCFCYTKLKSIGSHTYLFAWLAEPKVIDVSEKRPPGRRKSWKLFFLHEIRRQRTIN